MCGCHSELNLALAALIEQPSTNCKDSTLEDIPGPDSLEDATTNSSDKEPRINHTESQPSPLLGRLPPLPLVVSLPYPASCSSTPTNSCGSPACGPHSNFTTPLNIDLLNAHPSINFDLRPDPILHSYGLDCRSPEDEAKTILQHDKALVNEYIRSSNRLTNQLAYMRDCRKKKKTDHGLAQDYRFIAALYASLKTMKFKPPPHQHVSSKAILSCLDVTSSWLCRANKIVKLLDQIGPNGLSPDPLVIQRLESKVLTNKGSDLLTFLTVRANAISP